MSQDRWLVVGLGNPGPDYQHTRHNAGFMVVDALAADARVAFAHERRFAADLASVTLGGARALLAKPQTFMNRSGQAVARLVERYQLVVSQIIVIHDDVDLPLGRLKLKQGGGDGGHNGLKSLTEHLESNAYYRVRFGVGRPDSASMVDFVLSPFIDEELPELAQQLDRAVDAVTTLIRQGLREAMNRFNARPKEATGTETDTSAS
ncbi:MAG: aminoacyl-tRNA hydrolase [Deltaproteobacteria bacterium]|nr:aminoacyl-tRNA hydrolase [Deltaproteobacteria bacterium]